jgi:L-asparaginase II
MAGPLSVAVLRGSTVESRHRVNAVRVDGGRVVESWGDPELVSYMRSVAKPLQALPLVRVAPELPAEEIAIASASHEALPDQLEAVKGLLARSWSTEDDLECGPDGSSRLRHNCSGKHAGMLLVTRRREWPLPGYRLPGHPLQEVLRAIVADACGLEPGPIPTAVDGCGVVTFAVPLRSMARAFSRLLRGDLDGADRVVSAMLAHPELIGGPDSDDTAIMGAFAGSIAKRGAEGLLCVGLPDGSGLALKVEDGANRATGPAAARILGLDALAERPVINSRKERVGTIRPEI